MPSVKWAIAIEKKNTATDRKPRSFLRVLRTSRFARKKAPPPARPAGPAELKTGLSFLGANREVGGRYSHLDAVLKAYVGIPLAV